MLSQVNQTPMRAPINSRSNRSMNSATRQSPGGARQLPEIKLKNSNTLAQGAGLPPKASPGPSIYLSTKTRKSIGG